MSYSRVDNSVAEHVRRQVVAGFRSAEDIVESSAEVFEIDPKAVIHLFEAELAELEAAKATWPAVTDCDRLDGAFRDLEQIGILARHNFACCNRCGHYEMGDEVYAARTAGRRIEGYVFYHWQDTDRAVDGEELHLRYATLDDAAEDGRAIGDRVKAALAARGLTTEWDGNPNKTIQVQLDWKRRNLPAAPTPVRSPAVACAAWSARMIDLSRDEIAISAPLETLLACNKLEAAVAMAHAALGFHRARMLATVARGMSAAGQSDARIDATWLEAIEAVPYGPGGELAVFFEGADTSRSVVRDALRTRVQQEREDAAGAAATAWLLVRDLTLPDQARAALVERVERIINHAPEYELAHTTAARAALWILAVRSGADATVHREACLAAQEESRVEYSYARALVHIAKRETGEEQAPPLTVPLAVADAEAALTKMDADYAEGLATPGELNAAQDELMRAVLHAGDIARATSMVEASLITTMNNFAEAEREMVAWVTSVQRGAKPVRPVDESWFTDEGRNKLDEQRAKWKKDSVHRNRAGIASRKILSAATAYAQRGDLATAKTLIAEAVPDIDAPPRRTEAALIEALVAVGELDQAVAVAKARSFIHDGDSQAPLISGLARAGRTDEALAHVHRALDGAVSRSTIASLAPAVLALAPDPSAMAGLLRDAWSDADAAMAELVAHIRS